MNNDILYDLAMQLYAELLTTMPVDTGNMINHTMIQFNEDEIKIIISAPTKRGYNYAYDVNYNKQRGKKEKRNFQYVERCINRATKIVAQRYGGEVNGVI